MKTIAFAASKGGVGKTTLAFNCAVEAAKTSTVFVGDAYEDFAAARKPSITPLSRENG